MIEIEKINFNVEIEIDERIYLNVYEDINDITFRVLNENGDYIFDRHLNLNVGVRYWFEPDDKSYLKKESYYEISSNNEIIFRKKIKRFYEIVRDNKRNIIVQLGANRGNDSLSNMVIDEDFVLLVEPFEKFNDQLKKCYESVNDVHIENLLIINDDSKEEEIIYSHRDMDWISENGQVMTFNNEQASVMKSHVLKHFSDETGLIENKIKCSTINKLFEKYNLKDIDILFIDIEGMDDVVIKSIDFDKYNIHKIFYEDIHINKNEIEKFLLSKGYSIKNDVLFCAMTTLAIKNIKKPKKNYVQIGSNVGNDSFQRIIENSNESLNVFLIEPNDELFEELSNNYKNLKNKHNITIINSGVSIVNETVDLYLYDDTGHSSILNRKTHPNKTSKKINCLNFNDLCKEYSIDEIEVLSIDTEGLDYEILNSINTSILKINNIFFEKWVHDDDDSNGKYRSGPSFLNSHIIPKYKNYTWDTVIFDGMETYKLTKKNYGVFYKDLGVDGHGRLGNQFFEISASISLALDNNTKAIFPDWKYNKYFKNGIKTGYPNEFNIKNEYHDANFGYHNIPYSYGINLHGYFQSEKYFKNNENIIRYTFTLKEQYDNEIRDKWNYLLKTNTVSIHVRRGDYLNNPSFHIQQSLSYYYKSLKYIEYLDFFNKIDNVLIFSDDIEWCKNNFINDKYKFNFIENQNEIEDIFLMSFCNHNIITNSSFSWWGSWLNNNPNKIICAPSQWFGDGWDMKWDDIYCDNMKIIKC